MSTGKLPTAFPGGFMSYIPPRLWMRGTTGHSATCLALTVGFLLALSCGNRATGDIPDGSLADFRCPAQTGKRQKVTVKAGAVAYNSSSRTLHYYPACERSEGPAHNVDGPHKSKTPWQGRLAAATSPLT